MRMRNTVLFGSMLLAIAACDPSSVNMPATEESVIAQNQQLQSISGCGDGYECASPTWLGGVHADPSVIAGNCPEFCGPGAVGLYVNVDANPDWTDSAAVNCPDFGVVMIGSSHSCWDCRGSCAGNNCPDGASCATIPRQPGSDCQAFQCPAGWEYYYAGGFQPPTCRRPAPPPPPAPPAPPSTIASTVSGRPYLSWDAVPGATSYRIYRQLEWQAGPESWYTTSATSYHDGSTNVISPPQSNPPKGKWARYYVVSVNAGGESSYSSHHYYSYSGITPY